MSRYSKTYELPLSRDYVRHWGMLEGVREILQNAIDSDSPFEYVFGADSLIVKSRNATLDRKSLLLGATSKADCKDKIGSFGEGYKIALLVLTREGYAVTVHNGARTWTPTFQYSRQFEAPVLCIEDMSARRGAEGLAFEIKGLSPSDIEKIRDSCLLMQKEVGEIIETPKGNILVNRGGKLYVGGLYVCDTEMNYGYDVKPEFLRLERDRQTVSGWELKYITKEMWAESGRFDQMAALLEAKAPDVEAATFGMPEMVKEACYKLFASKHPGAVPVTSQAELNSLVKGTLTVYVSDGYRNGIVGARVCASPDDQDHAAGGSPSGMARRKPRGDFRLRRGAVRTDHRAVRRVVRAMNLASRIRDAIAAPTVVGPTERQVGNGVHESVMRSYQILEIVKDLVRVGTPAKVVLELVEFIEDAIPKNEKARES